jgi:hypothetical protein
MHIGITFDDSVVTFYVNGARIGAGDIGTISLPRALCLGILFLFLFFGSFQTVELILTNYTFFI